MSDLPRPLGTYVTRGTRVFGYGLLGACVAAGVLTTVDSGPEPTLYAWLLLIAAIIWVGVLRPRVVADHSGIRVLNLLRDVHVPWPQAASFGARWALEIFTPQARRIASWGIPARRDLLGASRAHRDRVRARYYGGRGAPSDPSVERAYQGTRIDAAYVKAQLELAQLEWRRGDYGHAAETSSVTDAATGGSGPAVTTTYPWQAWAPLVVGAAAVLLTTAL